MKMDPIVPFLSGYKNPGKNTLQPAQVTIKGCIHFCGDTDRHKFLKYSSQVSIV
jgi:hypothetical protein